MRNFIPKFEFSSLFDIIFPQFCIVCEQNLEKHESFVCWKCLSDLEFAQNHFYTENEITELLVSDPPVYTAASFMIYRSGGVLQEMIHQLKYKQNKLIGTWLGIQMAENLKDWLSQIDLIIPVPIHAKRKAIRGYNQSEVIAESISMATGIGIDASSLTKKVNNESQTHKTKIQRIANVENAYECKANHKLEGKNLLLLDDVITTGSTTLACVHEIYQKTQPASISALYVASQNYI